MASVVSEEDSARSLARRDFAAAARAAVVAFVGDYAEKKIR